MAKARPQTLYAELPVSPTTYDDGFIKVNYADFANLINGLAWWLKDTLGVGVNFETLAYIGPNDVRYNGLLLAAVKAGYKVRMSPTEQSFLCGLIVLTSPGGKDALHFSTQQHSSSQQTLRHPRLPHPAYFESSALFGEYHCRCSSATGSRSSEYAATSLYNLSPLPIQQDFPGGKK